MSTIASNASAALLLGVLLAAGPAAGQREGRMPPLQFHKGPVHVEGISGTVRLRDGAPPDAALEVQVRDSLGGAGVAALRLGFRGAGRDTVARGFRGERGTLPLAASARHTGRAGGTQVVQLDLAVQADGEPVADAQRLDVSIVLPPGARLLRSSHPLRQESPTRYRLARERAHPTFFSVSYTTGPVALAIDKQVAPRPVARGPVEVTLTVRNEGRSEARGVQLGDSYDPRDFAGDGPDFRLYRGQPNDERLLWSHTIERLDAGQTLTIRYTLTARNAVAGRTLEGATATLHGELVGVSNKVVLSPADNRAR